MAVPTLELLDESHHYDLAGLGINRFPSDSQRLVNAQTRACLTAVAPLPTTDKTVNLPAISAARATLPDAASKNNQASPFESAALAARSNVAPRQIWNVKKTPVPKPPSSTPQPTPPAQPPTSIPATPASGEALSTVKVTPSPGSAPSLPQTPLPPVPSSSSATPVKGPSTARATTAPAVAKGPSATPAAPSPTPVKVPSATTAAPSTSQSAHSAQPPVSIPATPAPAKAASPHAATSTTGTPSTVKVMPPPGSAPSVPQAPLPPVQSSSSAPAVKGPTTAQATPTVQPSPSPSTIKLSSPSPAQATHAPVSAQRPSRMSPVVRHRPPNTFIFESNSFTTTSGAQHAFRLDFKELPNVITNPTIVNVLDQPPNGLRPPVALFDTSPASTATPPVPAPPPSSAPSIATRDLVASPAGSATSSFVLIPADIPSRFWLYSPATDMFVGQPRPNPLPPSGPVPDGAPIQGGDLKKYFKDTQAYVHTQSANPGWNRHKSAGIWESFVKEMSWWMWEFVRVDFGPQQGAYRIIHNETLLCLDTPDNATRARIKSPRHLSSPKMKHPLTFADILTSAAYEIDPHARTQVWNVVPQPDTEGKGTISYTISNFSKSPTTIAPPSVQASSTSTTPQKPMSWQIISIQTGATSAEPTYLIYEPAIDAFLGLSPVNHTVVAVATGFSQFEQGGTAEEIILAQIRNRPTHFQAEWGWLAWKIIKEGWGPADDVYEIVDSVNSTYLDVSPIDFADPASLSLALYNNTPIGTSWWNVVAAVADDGSIYYTIKNYRSGATLDLANTTGNDIVIRRLSAPKGDRWKLIRDDETQPLFDLQKVESPGMALAPTPTAGVTLAPSSNASKIWLVQKVKFQMSQGNYYLVNIATNLVLSANTFLPNKPVLARPYKSDDSEQIWTISAPSTSSFFIEASRGGISVSAPPKDSVWTRTTAPDQMLPIAIENVSRTAWTFTKEQASNAFAIATGSQFLTIVKGQDGEHTVVLTSDTSWGSHLWRPALVGSALSPAPGSAMVPAPPNVPDGVYRILNRQTKINLVLGTPVNQGRPNHTPAVTTVSLSAKPHEYSPHELWYISRNRDSLIAPQNQAYTIRSLAATLFLDQADPDAKQRARDLTCWATARQTLYLTQQWIIARQAPFSFAIQSPVTGCLLDVDGSNLVCSPPLNPSPTATQMWQLAPVATPLTSGNYKISNIYTQTFLSLVPSPETVVSADYGAFGIESSDWRLTGLSDGLYRIERLAGLSCLSTNPNWDLILQPRDKGLECRWKLRPSINGGFLIENALSGVLLTFTDGSAEKGVPARLAEAGTEHDLPWQLFKFERLDSPARSFDDFGSDKIAFGNYMVTNVRTNQALMFASSTPAIGDRPVCASTSPVKWTVTPAATGFYSFQQSSMALGHGLLDPSQPNSTFPVALPDGPNATRWKLIKGDVNGTFRIVNYETGFLLVQSNDGTVACAVDDGFSAGQEWSIDVPEPPTKAATTDTPALSKEMPVQNNMFQIINSKTSNCITNANSTSLPVASVPRDLAPFSLDGRLQAWVVEQDRDGWYIIKSFSFNKALGVASTPSLVFAVNDGSSLYQWKFIRDANALTMRCINRRFPAQVLAAQDSTGALQLIPDSGDPLQRWTMQRISGTAPDTNVAQGVYIISIYSPPSIASAMASARTSQAKYQDDTAFAQKLTTIQNAVFKVSTMLLSKYPAPSLPTGVDVAAVKAALAPADWQNANSTTDIAANVVAFLYTASPPPASSSTPPPLQFETASSQIATSISDFATAALTANTVSDSQADTTAQSIHRITVTIKPLTDISSNNVQTLIKSLGNTILTQIAGVVAALPQPSSTSSASTTHDTLTLDTTLSAAAAAAQSAAQMWLLETAPSAAGYYTVSQLTTTKYLTLDTTVSATSTTPNIAVTSQLPGSEGFWKPVSQRMGGYAIFNAAQPQKVLCLLSHTFEIGCLSYVDDSDPASSEARQQQRWQLNRSGYYLQNQGNNNFVKVAAVDPPGSGVHLIQYPLFPQVKLISGSRADAYFIWHLIKIDGGYQLYSERTRAPLFNTGQDSDSVSANGTVSSGSQAVWKLAKQGGSLWFQCQDHGRFLALRDPNSDPQVVSLQDPGDKESWKGWQLVSVARTERGTFMTLPRCALLPPDQSMVFAVDPGSSSFPLVQQHYQPDNAYQRFRSVTFGNNTAYINEATLRVVQFPNNTVEFGNIDTNCWFVGDEGHITALSNASSSSLFQNTLGNTGDLPSALATYRIQVGIDPLLPAMVLGLNELGDLRIVPLNLLDPTQMWSYLEWGLGRFITHVQTSRLLSTVPGGSSLALTPGDTYTQSATWTVDVSNATAPNVSGFFKLRPAAQTDVSLQPLDQMILAAGATAVTASSSGFACRFVSVSTSFSFTSRAMLLVNFIKSYMPVFVHDKNAPLPVDVATYLRNSSLVEKTASTSVSGSAVPLPTSGSGDWVLQTNIPASDGTTATAYIVVRQTTEPIYVNYTDFTIWLLYAPASSTDTSRGWRSITMRVNNDLKAVESVFFSGLGWVYNINMNFSTLVDVKSNPLRIIKGNSDSMKLRVYVPPDLTITPFFPNTPVDADITTATNWGLMLDAGVNMEILEAEMIRDDLKGSKPVRPQWMGFIGRWFDGNGVGATGPR